MLTTAARGEDWRGGLHTYLGDFEKSRGHNGNAFAQLQRQQLLVFLFEPTVKEREKDELKAIQQEGADNEVI